MSSTSSSASSIAAPGERSLWRKCLRVGIWALAVGFGLVLALWSIVHWGLLPRVAQWKPWIEARATQELGQPVQIRAIEVTGHGWVPSLEMTDVRVLDGQGRTALRLERLRAALATHALLALELRFAQLHVDGVHLDVRRDVHGRIRVAGMDTQADVEFPDDGRAADWLFSQHEIAIRRGTVRWTDEIRKAPALDLSDVDLVLRNGLLRHEVRLDATPPVAWGRRLSLVGDFSQGFLERRGNWRAWSGSLQIDLPAADVGELRQYVHLPFDLRGGRGSVRAWLEAKDGVWLGATADMDLKDVRLRLAKHLETLEVASFSGRVRANRRPDGVDFAASKLALTTGGGLEWPLGDVALTWQQTQAASLTESPGPVSGGHFRADRLDLAVMADLASRLPLGRAVENSLKRLKPRGVVQGLDLRWTGPPDEPQRWHAKGRLTTFGLPAAPAAQPGAVGRPGVSGADVDFEFSETGGHADLAMQDGELQFPGVFEKPALSMADLRARLEWRVQRQDRARPAVEVRVTQARFANADAQGELQATWRTGRSGGGHGPGGYLPGEIDLTGRIRRAEAARVATYLPVGIPAAVRRYVGRAVKGGQVEDASFAVKGDVWHFPFHQGQPGMFRLEGQLRNVQFEYLPSVAAGEPEEAWTSPWPGLGQIHGELVFDRASMTLNHGQAQIWGVQLRNVQLSIDELGQAPVLRARGDGRGPLADMLRFVDVTPIGEWLGGALRPMSAQGTGELRLELGIPLKRPQQSTVKGGLALIGNDLQIRPDTPMLAAARGQVDFTHQGVQIAHLTARALGGELSVEGGTQADHSLRFLAQGLATAEGLARAKEFGPLPQVAQALRGQAHWKAQIDVVKGLPEITVSTDLVGMHSDWPAPLNKGASSAWPVAWRSSWQADRTESLRDEIRLDLGTVAQLRLLREWPRLESPPRAGPMARPVPRGGLSGPAEPDLIKSLPSSVREAASVGDRPGEAGAMPAGPRVLGGTVGLGQAAAPPQAGGILAVRGRLPRLDASAWSRALDGWPSGEGSGTWPRWHILAQIDELLLAQRKLTQVSLDARQDPVTGESWQIEAQADQLAGKLNWRPPKSLTESGQLTARLARLALPQTDGAADDPLNDFGQQRPPTLDLQVDEFSLRGRKLGRVELRASSRAGGATARDWSLERVQLEMPGGDLIAEGHWMPPQRPGGAGHMALNLSLNVQDSARLATHFGWVDAIRGGNGLLQGNLAWSGSPTAPDYPSMEGQLHLALNQGQFLRAEPGGLGRLLGILSLQALPRRLLLDFRDVFQQGFAFDQVTGDIQIIRGRAKTDNLRMRGLQATVFIDGSADLLKETQDLRVLIVPEVNAGAASLAYVAVNPAVGLGTFLAQMLLRDPLRIANTREFLVSGPMSDPRVERVERSPGAVQPRPDRSDGTRDEARPP